MNTQKGFSTKFTSYHSSGNTLRHRDHNVFYQTEGNGEALLLLHGFPTSSWDWHKVWPQLSKNHKVIAPDFIGFGFSSKPKGYLYSIMDQADICERLLRELKVKEVHLLAHDYGDTVAQELLARFNERQKKSIEGIGIKSVCLLNGGLFPETHKPKLIQKLLLSPIGPLLALFLGREKLRKTFHDIFGPKTPPTEEEIDEFWELLSRNGGKKIMPRLIRYMPERVEHRERWVSALKEARIPIRLINGAKDPISGAHMADRYRELIPEPDIVMLDQIGHYPQTEAPEAVLNHYQEFRNL